MNIHGISKLLAASGFQHVLVAADYHGEDEWIGNYALRPTARSTPLEVWQTFCKKFKLKQVTRLHELQDFYAPYKYEFATPNYSVALLTSCNPLAPETTDRAALGSVMLRVRLHANPDVHTLAGIRSELMRISTVPRTRKRATKDEMLSRKRDQERRQEADEIRDAAFQAFQKKRGTTLNDFKDLGK